MFKAVKEVAVPLEKLDSQFKAILRAKISEFLLKNELTDRGNELPGEDAYQLSVKTLPSGRKVYCARKATNPSRNRKHLVRSLLIR